MTAVAGSQTATKARRRQASEEWRAPGSELTIGKDVLELLSSSMYVDPMAIYREYLQNSADSIEAARQRGLDTTGTVRIGIDQRSRTVSIRDDGEALSSREFADRLLAIGASTKRGTQARGFRGVGRLAGLGYCQELIFRSRTPTETLVSEMRWDCRALRAALRSSETSGDLNSVVKEVVSTRLAPPSDEDPPCFFEVELKGVVRHRNDRLLSPTGVADYLSQCAPVPFRSEFKFAKDITAALNAHVALGEINIEIAGVEGGLRRPHGEGVELSDEERDPYDDLEIRHLPGVDGGLAAIVWVAHHGYAGAVLNQNLVKGLRVRCGNMQIGEHALFEDLFPEPRFNAWTVGEVHIIDRRILPNGRRDHFEQNVHFDNLLSHLSPLARDIARRCRSSSALRKSLRLFELSEAAVRDKLAIIRQGSVRPAERKRLGCEAGVTFALMEKLASKPDFSAEQKKEFAARIKRLKGQLNRALNVDPEVSPLSRLAPKQRMLYEQMFELIYECASNRSAAKSLIDRILLKVA